MKHILIDGPYVSEFLIKTIEKNNIPVIQTKTAVELLSGSRVIFMPQIETIERFRNIENGSLYCNSENSISWIDEHLKFTALPYQIKQLKNKYLFRDLLCDLYPELYYVKLPVTGFDRIEHRTLPFPCIVKPCVGFFSLGVQKVLRPEDWKTAIENVKHEINSIKTLYPKEVLDTREFIVEQCIAGEEYAVDCYYDEYGSPVILNVLKHLFSSNSDVNDRVYITSGDIIKSYGEDIGQFLQQVGRRLNLRNFPAHVEVRIDQTGKIVPIEFNPMRFGGWCSTPDLAWHAYGINVYECYFYGKKPDWNRLLKGKDNVVYGNIVLNNSTGIQGKEIEFFDYDKLLSDFENPLELRKADFHKYPLFGFLFVETRKDNFDELTGILNSDLKEYIA